MYKQMSLLALSSLLLSVSAHAQYNTTPSGSAQYNPAGQQPGQSSQSQYQYQPPQQPYQGSYGPPPTYYPTYPVYPGGYLPQGPVDPGEDEANRIYEQNQHAPR